MADAVIFDFNGTLSDDEPLLARVYQEQFAELGRPITEAEYYEHLAGHTDEEMFRRWFGHAEPAHDGLYRLGKHFPRIIEIRCECRLVHLELGEAALGCLVRNQAVTERHAEVAQHGRVREIALPA